MGFAKLLCFLLLLGVAMCDLWSPVPYYLLNGGNHTAKGLYFVQTSAADSTPLLVAVEEDWDNDFVYWYSWDATSNTFNVENQFALNIPCDVADSQDSSSSYLLNTTESPTGHPLLFFGCSIRSPIMLDLWTLEVTPFNSSSIGEMVDYFFYSPALPWTIFGGTASNSVYAWDIQTGNFIWNTTNGCEFCSPIVPVGDASFIQGVQSQPDSYLLQWSAKGFYANAAPDFNVSLPASVYPYFAPVQAEGFLFAIGRYFPAYDSNNTAFIFSVTDGASPQTDEEFELSGPASAAIPDKVIIVGPYAVAAMELPSILVTVLAKESIIQVETDAITLPSNFSANFADLIAVPEWAQAQFPFAFILQEDLMGNLSTVYGSALFPYTLSSQ